MTDTSLLYLLAGLVLAALALLLALLLRRPEAALDRLRGQLEEALRAEQRDGRLELRQQLDGLAATQGQRIDGFARHLADLGTRTDTRLDQLRDTLTEDARKGRLEAGESQQRFVEGVSAQLRELTQRNEQRIGEMRATLEQKLREL
jgi:DNA recombination protein RmuC